MIIRLKINSAYSNIMFTSPNKNWQTTFKKYSPSTNIKYNPVVPSQANLAPIYFNDEFTQTTLWALITTEEHYYQNCIELLSIHRNNAEKTKILLNSNRTITYWEDRLINFHPLGSGAFGVVYKAEDALTNTEYAVKSLYSKLATSPHGLYYNFLNVMREKAAYMRANDSSFIVKMHGAFQDDTLQFFWLIFEFCIGNLETFIREIEANMALFMDEFLEKNVVTELYSVYLRKLDLDLEYIGCIFSFELFAGIAYLAKRNLVHSDIKPDNILLSTRGHLKIADLGLTQRVKWLDRRSATQVVVSDELETIDEINKKIAFGGNARYTDPEALITNHIIMDEKLIYQRFSHPDFPIINGNQDFLTDLYAMALLTMDILFAGLNFLVTEEFSLKVIQRFNINTSESDEAALMGIRSIYDGDVHNNYLLRILENQTTDTNASIMKFLISVFKPKSMRADGYTMKIEHVKFKNIVTSRCIDIRKIENIEFYKSRNITEYNVCSFELPSELFHMYNKEMPSPIAENFSELQKKQKQEIKYLESELKMPTFQFVE